MILRRTHPDFPRPFRTPFVPLVPILGAIICLAQMVSLPLGTWLRLIVWMLIGFVIYFTYSRRHSKLARPPFPPDKFPVPKSPSPGAS
jgi:APA family basic amino acid/polyamine antiporter